MSIIEDMARESDAQFLYEKIVKKIKKYPEAEKTLKEIGLEFLNELPIIPKWARHYYNIFNN